MLWICLFLVCGRFLVYVCDLQTRECVWLTDKGVCVRCDYAVWISALSGCALGGYPSCDWWVAFRRLWLAWISDVCITSVTFCHMCGWVTFCCMSDWSGYLSYMWLGRLILILCAHERWYLLFSYASARRIPVWDSCLDSNTEHRGS